MTKVRTGLLNLLVVFAPFFGNEKTLSVTCLVVLHKASDPDPPDPWRERVRQRLPQREDPARRQTLRGGGGTSDILSGRMLNQEYS